MDDQQTAAPTETDYARRQTVALETLVKFAKAWTAIAVVVAVIGLLVYLQAVNGPTTTP